MPVPNLKIVVNKTGRLLTLYSGATPLKSYQVEIGDSGLEDKQVAGDHKTPEGSFYIAEKSVFSPPDQYLGTRWMRLSYPNIDDARRGLNSGLIDQATYDYIVGATNSGQIPPQYTPLGGGIGIHGGNDTNGPGDWTWGCVGLANADVNEIYDYVSVGTPVVIQAVIL
ncbi:MAG: L,D-transpeptidase [Bacillota bacterium]